MGWQRFIGSMKRFIGSLEKCPVVIGLFFQTRDLRSQYEHLATTWITTGWQRCSCSMKCLVSFGKMQYYYRALFPSKTWEFIMKTWRQFALLRGGNSVCDSQGEGESVHLVCVCACVFLSMCLIWLYEMWVSFGKVPCYYRDFCHKRPVGVSSL